jgi:hypothetical protein
MRIVIIPGMGCTPVAKSNWYKWLANNVNNNNNNNNGGLAGLGLHCDLSLFSQKRELVTSSINNKIKEKIMMLYAIEKSDRTTMAKWYINFEQLFHG